MRAVIGLLAAFGLASCQKPDPDVTVLTYASLYTEAHPFSQADLTWISWIEAQTNGRIRIKPHWGGHTLSSNDNVLEMRHGVAEIGLITPMYSRSAHVQRIQPSFYSGVGSIQQQIDVYRCLADEFPEINGDVHGVEILAVQGGNFPGVLTRDRPIRKLEDFRGLRLRAQADTAEVLRALGADPVNMSMSEVYPAMSKGVIDGVVTPVDALKAQSLADVGQYFSTLKIPRGAYPGRAMSPMAWDRLTPQEQALFRASHEIWERAIVAELEAALQVGHDYARSAGIQEIPMDAGEQERFDKLYRANAFRISGELEKYGVNGRAMAARATQLIADGVPPDCGD